MSWHVTLLGKIEATREGATVSRFESSRAVALLARLALFPQRTHPREELSELLWPDIEPEIGRRRLRHLLGTLRAPLEAGLSPGSVLVADKHSIRANPDAVTTDVAEFERALKNKDFDAARKLYAGELLPGLYDDWILEERYRLEALAEGISAPASSPANDSSPRRISPPLRRRPSSASEEGASLGEQEMALSLPPYLTAFFGRETEREQVAERLSRSRLVTLTGLGGTGKTRLAVEVLQSLAPSFTHAAFVALGECLVASQVPGRIRDVLRLPAVAADPLTQVVWALTDSPALLVLDNLEQLVDSGGAELVETLLATLPQLTLLVTSRRALGIAGERLFPLEALPEADAIALFLDRVQATRPGFRLTDGNKADVLAVCEGLEGIPLALELAAARIRAFSPSEMRAELTKRFEWLARTGLKGDKDDRHRSLSAALEWSWRLLPTAQQQFLANLSLFRAPFTSAEAASVTGYPDARERLENLSSDSLVQCASGDDSDETRHALLETVREFALARLMESAEARARFQGHYLAHPTRDENTVTAWQYALEDDNGANACGFALVENADWIGRIGVARTRDFLERSYALPGDDSWRRLSVARLLAECLARIPDRKGAMALMAEAVAPLEAIGGELLAEGLKLQALVGQFDVVPEVTRELLDRCLALTQDETRRADALRLKGAQLLWTDGFEGAQELFDQADLLYPDGARGKRILVENRAHLARRRQDGVECLRLMERAIELAKAAEDSAMARNCQANLPPALAQLERWEDAISQSLKCIEIESAIGDRFQLLSVLWNLACYYPYVGQAAQAAKLIAAVATLWESVVRPLSEEEQSELGELRQELVETLDEATIARLWEEGESLTLKEALALARG